MSYGMGAMLHYLSGGSEHNPEEYYNKVIDKAFLEDDIFNIHFKDGIKITITDEGQSCCESRYITTDDEPSVLNGHKLIKIETKEAPTIEDVWEVHEQVFIEIATDKAFITLTTHNEHNGYYGGVALTIKEVNS